MLRLMAFCLLLMPAFASAATVVGIVSERSAAEMAAGAHEFLDAHPDHEVVLRTPEQLAGKSDSEVAALWQDADAVLLAAVFGDQVGRLERLMRQQPPAGETPILAINSDRRITRLSRLGGERVLDGLSDDDLTELTLNPDPGEDAREHLAQRQERFADQADWLTGRAFYQGRSPEHIDGLFRWLLAEAGESMDVPEPRPRDTIRYYRHGTASPDADAMELDDGPAVALLDTDYGDRPGDRDLLDAACAALEERGIQCFAVLARWGGASVEAVETLAERAAPADLAGVVSLQYFTVGGGEGRRDATAALTELDVPVIKGIRLSGLTEPEWLLSEDGIPWDSVHYQLAMPELQGISQPMVLAVSRPTEVDERTGLELSLTRPVDERVTALAHRLQRWSALQTTDNADKRVALVYYNHPPGRHNVGADKLDVPESLFEMLQQLQAAGYDTGELPESAEALHDKIQDRGINLPDNRAGLDDLLGRVPSLSREEYRAYFDTLPEAVQAELEHGPVGYLHARLMDAKDQEHRALAESLLERSVGDLRHMLRNHEHASQQRALDLLRQYEQQWQALLDQGGDTEDVTKLRDALIRTGIPGLSGWGDAPGEAMVRDGEMVFPGVRFGNVFIGPQPPRGWEVSESLLHANTTFPPTHQYVGFYHWMRDHFEADALVYVGRHSTREFLPRRRAGLAGDDYPEILGGDLPVIYPYIVDGVGEGIQAKRRAMGVMISHLTPALETTELYDDLLELRQLVETFESATDPDSPTRARAVETLRERIEALDLTEEIEHELEHGHDHDHGDGNGHGDDDDHGSESAHDEHGRDEADHAGHEESHDDPDHADEHHDDDHGSRSLDDVDEELLVHEVGHYVTHMQEQFMPIGLHVFGRDWDDDAVDMMIASMAGDDEPEEGWREDLANSPGNEMANFLAALEGRFVEPGRGNDPVRTPAVLPTGRNFHALSGDLVPTRVAWSLGQEMAADARDRGDPEAEGSEAIVLWASDTVRDEGVMVAFGLDMLGVRPKWNSRGIVEGLERMPLEERSRRRDALLTTSGLFRDLYEDQLVWLDQAVRVALDGASETIRAEHPQLDGALDEALRPLPDALRDPGDEPLERNDVAARWVADTREMLGNGADPRQAGRDAALRVFGTAPGSYGAGVNRLAERSGAWEDRAELADAYLRRMGHAYGKDASGEPSHAAFESRLQSVGRTYLGRASHVYGLLDNDDGFDFQGGLSLAVETLTGDAPDNRVLMHADVDNPRVESLHRALLGELRRQNLNPQWLEPLMNHGYAGARTMGADFMDNLWGWQVTNPEVVRSWVWDAVNDVYFQDSHGIGLDDFLEEDHNIHVKMHMQAITLVAAHREFWDADEEVLDELIQDFAESVVEHGLPGGGHTRPDHPTMDWVADQLADAELAQAFDGVRAAAQMDQVEHAMDPATVAEISITDELAEAADDAAEEQQEQTEDEAGDDAMEGGFVLLPWLVVGAAFLLLAGGVYAGRRF
ncbi:cobaltochelatase subunit CobN [Aquisalimonas sp. 2447]|uniref:cobaltochelatase subunit CobN n=1 Tax=Aquisalimonas sp. 2447 TaxID=2740807 RepID=UPI0020C45A38|nr:cobaltochelatase subunit CobN [Aquisalimonas sp. 2447]